MTATLAQLLSPQTPQQVFSSLLGQYQAAGFPVQSWQPFGVERTRLMAFATVLSDLSINYNQQIAAGGFLDLAAALSTPDWLQLLASNNYDVPFNEANQTIGNITLTTTSTTGPYTVPAGKLIASFAASGNRYISTTALTIPNNGSVTGPFVAEFAGAKYNDPSDSGSITLVNPLSGVTVTNPSTTYSTVQHVGAGTGTLTLGGFPTGSHSLTVLINSTGASGVATWSYSLDGSPYSVPGAAATVNNIGGFGINVTLTNGASGTSFVGNDTYYFVTPAPWITTQGSDLETNASLAQRCRNRWSSLSPIPTNSFYQLLATSTPSVGSQVTQVVVVQDSVVNNKVNIVVAGPSGALPVGTVAAIQAYVNPRVPITDYPVVVSPSQQNIVLAATISVAYLLASAAKTAVSNALTSYISSVGINGTIRLSTIIELIRQVSGIIDVDITTVKINGQAANFTLGSSSTFVVSNLSTLDLTGLVYNSQ